MSQLPVTRVVYPPQTPLLHPFFNCFDTKLYESMPLQDVRIFNRQSRLANETNVLRLGILYSACISG